MPDLRKVTLTPLASLYARMATPFNPLDVTSASFSIIIPRGTTTLPPPLVQHGVTPCPPLQNLALPEVSILYLPDAILSNTGAVVYANEFVIAETVEGSLEENGFIKNDAGYFFEDSEVISSSETVLNVNRHGTWNYSLFMAELLPLALVAMMNPLTSTLRVPILFKEFMSAGSIENRYTLLRSFGIDPDRTFQPQSRLTRYKGVVIIKANDRYTNHRISQLAPMVSSKLIHQFADEYAPHARRLYISRQRAGNRQVKNFAELEPVLQRFNVLPVELDDMPQAQQVNLFSKADLVVAEHGAGLVNTMFMRPGSTVMEVFPASLVGRWMYRGLANVTHLNYVFGSFSTPDGWKWNEDPVLVPCELYAHLLQHA